MKIEKEDCPNGNNLPVEENKTDFEVNSFLLNNRQIFLYDDIEPKSACRIIKELRALDLKEHKPIFLWINSYGGCVNSGFSIIDTIETINSHIVTVVNGVAASMAGLLSCAGDIRLMTPNSWWMAHDISGFVCDYGEKSKYRVKNILDVDKQCLRYFKKKTKMNERDYDIAKNGELWLSTSQCLKKGIIDKIFKFQRPKVKPVIKMA